MPTRAEYDVAKLGSEMVRFATRIHELGAPNAVLDRLHATTQRACSNISVLGAVLWPMRRGDWGSFEKGKTVFLHESAPEGWWEEWLELNRVHPSPSLALAWLSLAPFIKSEMMTALDPLGVDRWPFELQLKYGIRDGLVCPVGGRWLLMYWSRDVLSQSLSDEARAMLFLGASFAAIRLQQLVGPLIGRLGQPALLTAREVAVLRLYADGYQTAEAARLLGLGEETVRTHLKKAQGKLGVRTRTHAVAQAIRLQLIP
jgi:LuxR family quorum sensing-dependent transcriptional regulator